MEFFTCQQGENEEIENERKKKRETIKIGFCQKAQMTKKKTRFKVNRQVDPYFNTRKY